MDEKEIIHCDILLVFQIKWCLSSTFSIIMHLFNSLPFHVWLSGLVSPFSLIILSHEDQNVKYKTVFFAGMFDEVPDSWFCPRNCGRKYKYKKDLTRHLTYECGVPKKFHCVVCNKRFAQKVAYKSHMGVIHKTIIS